MLSSMDITLRMQFPSLKTQCWYPCFKLTLKSDCVGLAYGLISLVSQANSWSSYSELERKGSLDTNRLWKIAFIRRVWGTAEMIWDCHVRTAILYLVPQVGCFFFFNFFSTITKLFPAKHILYFFVRYTPILDMSLSFQYFFKPQFRT